MMICNEIGDEGATMDTLKCEAFVTAARLGSLTEAAHVLG